MLTLQCDCFQDAWLVFYFYVPLQFGLVLACGFSLSSSPPGRSRAETCPILHALGKDSGMAENAEEWTGKALRQ